MSKDSKEKTNSKGEMAQEIKEFIDVSIVYLKSLGTFAKKIGEVEKRYPEALKMMQHISSPETLTGFVSKAPPEIVVSLLKIFIRASSLSTKMGKDISELTADEKIELGKELIALANEMSGLMKRAEE